MQKFYAVGLDSLYREPCEIRQSTVLYLGSDVDAEIESLKAQLCYTTEERDIAHRELAKRDCNFEPKSLPQPPNILPYPPSHEESYSNNLTAALESCRFYENAAERLNKERDTLRDVLTLLAPDLKTMAILYQQQGDHTRAQALNNICKSVGLS